MENRLAVLAFRAAETEAGGELQSIPVAEESKLNTTRGNITTSTEQQQYCSCDSGQQSRASFVLVLMF